MGVTQNTRFIKEKRRNMDDLGVHLFQETSICINMGWFYGGFRFVMGVPLVLSSMLQMDFPLETIQLLGYPIDGNPHMGYMGHTTYEATVWNFLVCADRCYIPLKMVTTYYGFWGAPLARPETCCRVSAVSIDDLAAPETLREVVTVHWQVWNGGFLK